MFACAVGLSLFFLTWSSRVTVRLQRNDVIGRRLFLVKEVEELKALVLILNSGSTSLVRIIL